MNSSIEMSELLPGIALVVGCQRSGTTLCAQMLGAHSSCQLVDETDDIYSDIDACLQGDLKRHELVDRFFNKSFGKYPEREPIDLQQHAANLVIQAPNLTHRAADIRAQLGDVKVVFMIRDVRAVVASMLDLPQIKFVENQCRFFSQNESVSTNFPDDWKALTTINEPMHVRMARVARIKVALAKQFRDCGLPLQVLTYESLVSSPSDTIRAAANLLQLPDSGECLAHHRIMEGFGPGSTDRSRAVDTNSLGKWRSKLTESMIDEIWATVGAFYEQLGYYR